MDDWKNRKHPPGYSFVDMSGKVHTVDLDEKGRFRHIVSDMSTGVEIDCDWGTHTPTVGYISDPIPNDDAVTIHINGSTFLGHKSLANAPAQRVIVALEPLGDPDE